MSSTYSQPPLTILEQGRFAVGGSVVRHPGTYDPRNAARPDGQTLHGDHAFVSYQIPANTRKYPLVYVHGNGQFSKTWQTTPDGREGFHNLFLRRGFSSYLVDSPRRGAAGRSTLPLMLNATPDDQAWFDTFRVGIWPDYFPGVQFARDPETLNQYFRQMTPDTGPFDVHVTSSAIAALFDKIGPAVMVSHSQGGGVGWFTALKSAKVAGIVSYEPGTNFPFPEGEVPPPMPSAAGLYSAVGVPLGDFKRLTRMPVVIYYGDYVPRQPVPTYDDKWRVRLAMARLWIDVVNRHGGDATLVELPDLGIRGNTHFPFSDLNNVEVAEVMAGFLASKQLM